MIELGFAIVVSEEMIRIVWVELTPIGDKSVVCWEVRASGQTTWAWASGSIVSVYN